MLRSTLSGTVQDHPEDKAAERADHQFRSQEHRSSVLTHGPSTGSTAVPRAFGAMVVTGAGNKKGPRFT